MDIELITDIGLITEIGLSTYVTLKFRYKCLEEWKINGTNWIERTEKLISYIHFHPNTSHFMKKSMAAIVR